MFNSHVSADVIVIGAGIAGLMAARILESKGASVTIIDKGRSVGGRLATRRIGTGLADHGAQFFTVRTPEFQKYVDQWLKDRVIYVWSHGWSDGSLKPPSPEQGHPRYATYGGMNVLAKHIARNLKDIRLETRMVTATRDEHGWVFQDEEGNIFVSKAVIMTPPVPQSLTILEDGATMLNPSDQTALENITYAPSLTGIFWIDGKVTLPLPGAIQRKNANVAWIADNQTKGISPDATILTVQASETFSTQMWSAPDDRALNALRAQLELYLAPGADIREGQLKRWRYASPQKIYPERCMVAKGDLSLVFAGDAFGGPRTEGAALSGLAAGQKVLEMLV